MKFIGYNTSGSQVHEENGKRYVISKAGNITASEETLGNGYIDRYSESTRFCRRLSVNNSVKSLAFSTLNTVGKLDYNFYQEWKKNCGSYYNDNNIKNALISYICQGLRAKSQNGVILTKDIQHMSKVFNGLSEIFNLELDLFDKLIKTLKLTIDFDHVKSNLSHNSYLRSAVPEAHFELHSHTDCEYAYMYLRSTSDVQRISGVNFTNMKMVILHGVGFDGSTEWVDDIVFNRDKLCAKVEVDGDQIIFITDEIESKGDKWIFFDDWLKFDKWYQKEMNVQGEAPEALDTDEYFDSIDDHVQYRPLSKVSPSFTMIPKSLADSTSIAHQRFVDTWGTLDDTVDGWFPHDITKDLLSEQMDAVGLQAMAARENCSFLLADATGIGKGRSLAAMALSACIQGKKVVYFTENAEINIPDVWRDITDVHGHQWLKPVIIAGKAVTIGGRRRLTPAEKAELFETDNLPPDTNMVLTNYSQMKSGEAMVTWLIRMLADEDCLVILDEAHNALSPNSNIGRNMRWLLFGEKPRKSEYEGEHRCIPRNSVVFATATPLRDIKGVDLYRNLVPQRMSFDVIKGVLERTSFAGQEAFTTMLSEAGTYLRRDHDLSDINIGVSMPSEEMVVDYHRDLGRFSELMSRVVHLHSLVGGIKSNWVHREITRHVNQLGRTREEAINLVRRDLFKSGSYGNMYIRLIRLFLNTIKVDQVVDVIKKEIDDGRKPMVTFHSTNEALIKKIKNQGLSLTFSSTVATVIDNMVNIKNPVTGEQTNLLNENNPEIIETYRDILKQSVAFNSYSASPIDHLMNEVRNHGVTIEEITGRTLRVNAEGDIVRRKVPNKREVVDRFNSGETDVIIYNQSGATGGSFHASENFKDQRPRSIVEMETPLDIIKYVQAQGRGNRYGQVNNPRILSVMTGLIPEMRILQQRNVKLKKLGASVDGSRSSHPMLMSDIPDLLNEVGDRAVGAVLRDNLDIAQRLGITTADNAEISSNEGLANKALNYSIVLSVEEQTALFERIIDKFNEMIDELDRANKNPLKLKEIRYPIEIIDTVDHQVESTGKTLTVSNGKYKKANKGYTSYQVYNYVSKVDKEAIENRIEEARQYLETNRNIILSPFVPANRTVEEIDGDQQLQPQTYINVKTKLRNIQTYLKQIKIGGVYTRKSGPIMKECVIIDIHVPDDENLHRPYLWRMKVIECGDSKVSNVSLGFFIDNKLHITSSSYASFHQGYNASYSRNWESQRKSLANQSVQVLSGDLMSALDMSVQNKWGSLCMFKTVDGDIKRGVVVEGNRVRTSSFPTELNKKILRMIMTADPMYKYMWGMSTVWELSSPAGFMVKLLFSERFNNYKIEFERARGSRMDKFRRLYEDNFQGIDKKYTIEETDKIDQLVNRMDEFRLFISSSDLKKIIKNVKDKLSRGSQGQEEHNNNGGSAPTTINYAMA